MFILYLLVSLRAKESLLKMQESWPEIEQEKMTEIEKLKSELNVVEESAKSYRWAYGEHMLCQQKVHPHSYKFNLLRIPFELDFCL
jgi:hypothetical protein